MAYKFQLGAYVASGSLTQEGALECETSLTIGSAVMSEADLEKLDGITNGTAAASKAIVLDASKNIATIGTIGCGAITSTGASTFGSINVGGTITGDTSLTLDTTTITTAEIGVLDSVTAGTAAASKAVVLDASKNIATIGTIGCGVITSTGTSVFASLDISGDIDVDGTTNLDAVDIDGAVQADGTITVGVDDTGYDVKFFGATTGQYMLWDESADELVLAGDSKLSFHDAAGGENIVASSNGHLEVNAGTTLDMTAPTIDLNASVAVTMDTPSFIVASSAEDTPVMQLKNTYNGVDGPELRFVMDKGAAGADNDSAGMITFYGDDDNQDNIKFGMIQVQVSDASNGAEGGKMSLGVANHDGGMGTGILIEDGSVDNEIDVTIGKGTSSVTSIAGELKLPVANGKAVIRIKDNIAEAMQIMTENAESIMEIKTSTGSETVKIGHGISGTAITLGHTTSEVTVADNLTVTGNLTVSGTTTTVDVEVVNTANGVIFEGATADGHETTLKAVDPTDNDKTHQLANVSGYLIPFAAVSTTAITATPAELNKLDDCTATTAELNYLDITTLGTAEASKALTIKGDSTWTVAGMTCANLGTVTTIDINGGTADALVIGGASAAAGTFTTLDCTDGAFALANLDIDGGTDIGEALVDADLFVVDNGAGGTNRKCAMSRLKTYMSDVPVDVAIIAATGTLAVGVNYFADMGSDGEDAVSLPASSGMSVGQSIKLKAPSDCSAARYITVNRAGSQTIDGAEYIRLESPFAAVELVYVAAETWRVF